MKRLENNCRNLTRVIKEQCTELEIFVNFNKDFISIYFILNFGFSMQYVLLTQCVSL